MRTTVNTQSRARQLGPATHVAVGALIVLAVAGCGAAKPRPRTDADVIRAWAMAVRHHDYKQAEALFAVPSIIDNGKRIRVSRRAEVDVFDRTLPCGAVVTGTAPSGPDRVLATFKLVAGPGGPCKGKAQVRFRIEKGHITEWVRTASGPPPDSVET
jgi:hypothetical protein